MFERTKNIFNRLTKRTKAQDWGGFSKWYPSFFVGGISKETALQTHAAVYGVVNRKSNALAQLPIKLYQKKRGKRTQADDYRAELVGVRPEYNRSAFVFWRTVGAMKEVYGNAYAFIERDELGRILQLKLLNPRVVLPFENEDDNNELYYQVHTKKGIVAVHHMDMLHFPSVYSNGYAGVSFLDSLATQLSLNKTLQETSKSQAENSVKVSGIIKMAANLNPEKKAEYQKQFADMYSKGWNSVLVLDQNADYVPLKFDFQDLKLLENNKITVQQVSMASGVPLWMLGEMDGAKYNNVEQQNIDFVQSCMAPDVVMIEQELDYKLLSPNERDKGFYFKFSLNALLRADMRSRAEYYNKMIPISGITPNEIRALEDMESLGPIGDRPLVTLNWTFLDILEDHIRNQQNQAPEGGDEDGKGPKTDGNRAKNPPN